ncbi:carbon starvation CstA family protein [Streptomyces yunnanensis]|uniref:Carbon starvation protein n=1 Tax=Streptomyces yunnanensis TaxID=156453 RepID=A0A9X8QQJ6_9ACTN|nr:carbon starvation protein [Streptomyces yunnanensis]
METADSSGCEPRRQTGRRALRIGAWAAVVLSATTGWAMLALAHGERINAVWLLVAAVCSYAVAYRFYARWIARRALRTDDTRLTPAERHRDGVDFVPTEKGVLFGHHFAAIAGAGPLVGPVLAAQMGYLPGVLWIVVGAVFAGAVQDMVTLFLSMRRDGRSLGQMARDELGLVGGVAAILAVLGIMVILLAVLALVVVNALAGSPWGTFSLAMTVPIALFMGLWLRVVRPGKVLETSAIGACLLLLAVVGGHWVAQSPMLAGAFTLSRVTLAWLLIGYGFLASVVPVWLLLAPRDYLSTFMKVGVISLMAVSLVVAMPDMKADAVSRFAGAGAGPVFAGSLFPFLFITIACGALSGFHALISSGTTPKLIRSESHVRFIGYGGMLTESFVAIMALIAACVLDPGLYYAVNSPAGLLGPTAQSAAHAVQQLGFTLTPDALHQAAAAVGEESVTARTGGAPTFALGLSHVLSQVLGGDELRAFWYHFAIMFEALFILTTVDAGTRVGRFMLQDALGNVWKPMRNVAWKPGIWLCSGLVVLAWGYFLLVGATDPLGGINQLFPLFGIANQLLAAIALALCTTVFIKQGRVRWAWITGVPLLWDVLVTLTASWQKVFSSDPGVGFLAQREQFAGALARGKVMAPAHSAGDMRQIVTNSTVDAVLVAVFVLLLLAVLVDAIRIWIKAVRSPMPLPTSEVDPKAGPKACPVPAATAQEHVG